MGRAKPLSAKRFIIESALKTGLGKLTSLQVASWISELDFLIRRPSDSGILYGDLSMTDWCQCQSIVEQRVGNCSAGNNVFSIGVFLERGAIGRHFLRKFSEKLVVIARLHVSSMVLVEVRQPVVHEDITNKVLVQGKANAALAFLLGIVTDVLCAC